MTLENSVTRNLKLARHGCSHSRENVGRWLLNHVRQRIVSHAKNQSLPDSVSAIHGDVLAKLVKSDVIGTAPNRAYLIGATTQAMIEVIADTVRQMNRKKRKPTGRRLPIELMIEEMQASGLDIIGLTEAINDLRTKHPRQATVVVLRYFGGMTVAEVAAELDISVSTVEADWREARVWLYRVLFG
jgi:RNA polymerase sigma factor (TIGR02999 family)